MHDLESLNIFMGINCLITVGNNEFNYCGPMGGTLICTSKQECYYVFTGVLMYFLHLVLTLTPITS